MQFLAPLFLVALAALAVPVVIHLIQRERKEALQFPSLMFLRQVPYKSVRRRRIRNWFLFLLRCAALVLLVAAFARPFVDRGPTSAAALDTSREVVILLDRSYSMGYGDRWDRARQAARGAVQALGPEDRATLVLFDGGAAAVTQATTDKLRLTAAIDAARIGDGITRYAPALKLGQSILDASDRPVREVLLISDFQRVGWDGEPGVRLPAGAVLRPVPVMDARTANVSVTDVVLRREEVSGRERVTASARLTNKGDAAVSALPVTLELDGRELQTVQVELEASGAATATFAPFTLPAARARGTVRAGSDALPRDNRFHFVLAPGQAIDVLVVDGGRAQSSLFLRRALALAERPAFRVESRVAGQLRAADLDGRSVVILNDATFPSGEVGRRLRSFVEAGGGLVVALGERAGANGWGEAAGLLPGTPQPAVDRVAGGGAVLGYLDYSHPVFEVFRAPRSGDLSGSRFFRYRPVTTEGGGTVLARFDDGSAALTEQEVGAGRVFVWASSLDTYWNDLPLQPVFLPFVHQLVRHAASFAEPSPWFTAGQVLDVARLDTAATAVAGAESATDDIVVLAPSGDRVALNASGLLRLDEQGFYTVRGAAGEARDVPVAVNLDLSESDLSTLDPEELASAVEPRGDAVAAARTADALPLAERERRQALWWYLLLTALLILAAETVVSNRLSRRRRVAES